MNKHILLVDDDASLRATLRACLEVAGFICTEAKDGRDARSWMERGHPVDLIVTDHQMPRVTGLLRKKILVGSEGDEIDLSLYINRSLCQYQRTGAINRK